MERASRVARAHGVLERAVGLLRLLEVAHELREVGRVGDHRGLALEPLLEEAAAAAVEVVAHPGRELLVDRVAREVVDEGVGRLAAPRPLGEDDLAPLERVEGESELGLALGGSRELRELARRRRPSEDREELEGLALALREAAHALEDDLGDGRRDPQRAWLVEARAPRPFPGLELASLDERAHELDDEEGVAARLLVDALGEPARQDVLAEHGLDEALHLLEREPSEREPGRLAGGEERGDDLLERAVLHVGRAVGRDHEEPGGLGGREAPLGGHHARAVSELEVAREVAEELGRLGVGLVEVVEQDDERPRLGVVEEELRERVEEPELLLLGRKRGVRDRGRGVLALEVGEQPRELGAELLEELRAERVLRPSRDGARAPREEVHDPAEDLREGAVGPALLRRAALDDRDLAHLGEGLELAEEAALPDPRLARDEDEPLGGRRRRRELEADRSFVGRGGAREGGGRCAWPHPAFPGGQIELYLGPGRHQLAVRRPRPDPGRLLPGRCVSRDSVGGTRSRSRDRRARDSMRGLRPPGGMLEAPHEERELLLAPDEAPARDPERGGFLGLDLVAAPGHLVERADHVVGGRGALGRVLGHEPEDERAHPVREVRPELARLAGLVVKVELDDLVGRLAPERQLARHDVVERAAERVEVGPPVHGDAARELGRYVGDGALDDSARERRARPGEPEVYELHERAVLALRDEDVPWLHVVVDETPRVDVLEPAADLDDPVRELAPGRLAARLEEVDPVHELGREEDVVRPLDDSEVVDLGEVRVPEAREREELVLHVRVVVAPLLAGHALERDLPAPLGQVARQGDAAHPSAPEDADDAVASVDELSALGLHGLGEVTSPRLPVLALMLVFALGRSSPADPPAIIGTCPTSAFFFPRCSASHSRDVPSPETSRPRTNRVSPARVMTSTRRASTPPFGISSSRSLAFTHLGIESMTAPGWLRSSARECR